MFKWFNTLIGTALSVLSAAIMGLIPASACAYNECEELSAGMDCLHGFFHLSLVIMYPSGEDMSQTA